MKSLNNTIIAAIIAVVLTALVAVLPWEANSQDRLMKLCYDLHQKYSPHPPDSHLVLAAIDEQSVRDLGRWPFPRGVHAQFLGVLDSEKPRTVAWDIFFTEESSKSPATAPSPTPATPDASGTSSATDANAAASLPEESDDSLFVKGVSFFPHLITAAQRENETSPLTEQEMLPTRPLSHVIGDISSLYSSKSARLPFPALRKVSYFGFADEDSSFGVRRSMPMVVNINGLVLPSFDLQTIMQFWDIDPDHVSVDIGHQIVLTKPDGSQAHIPIDKQGNLLINYRARLEDFKGLSYSAMAFGLTDKIHNKSSKERDLLPPLKDNLVVIGVTLSGTDAGVTPLEGNTPLVNTHLNVMNNILQQDFVYAVSPWIWLPVYGLFLFAVGNLMLRVGIAPMIPIGLLSLVLVAAVGFGALYFANLQIPVAMPEIGILLLAGVVPTKRFFGEEREKLRIRSAMSAYLSEKVMTKVLEHPDNVKLGGVKQEITVMFCDIRGFTKYCDNRDSQEVLTVLNEYMEEMTQVVFKYDGTVDKYIGDCIMAFWNAPQPQADHAQRAVCCAMEMRYALANFKTRRAGKDIELFECGIGIHTGEALVGNMGSSLKRNYTAMGSTVNMGARLEALTKKLNERILISQDVLNQLQGDFPLTDRGEAMVPGFANPIHVYAVGADQDISAALSVGRTLAGQQEYTAEEAVQPIWQPAPLPPDADPNP